MRLRSICGAALAATVLAMSACGGGGGSSSSSLSPSPSSSPTASFTSSFKTVTGDFKHGSQVIGQTIGAAKNMTEAQLKTAFKTIAHKWQTVLSKLESLSPPSNVATDFNTLRDAASRVETDLNAIVSAVSTHSASAAQQASATLVHDILTAKSAALKVDR